MADERMKPDGELPFCGERLVYARFDVSIDTGGCGRFGYVNGMIASVPDGKRRDFVVHAAKNARLFQENGVLRLVSGLGADMPVGKITDFPRRAGRDGETVSFGWIEWPEKSTCDAGVCAMMLDPRMREMSPAWNGPLAIFGGLTPILATDNIQGGPI